MIHSRSNDYIDKLLDVFQDKYAEHREIEYIAVNKGADRQAIGALLALFKAKNPGLSEEEMTDLIGRFFDACLQLKDKFLYENMRPPIMYSQINKIRILLNGKFGKSSKRSDAKLRDLAQKLTEGNSLLEFN